jgi:hypothetical protein
MHPMIAPELAKTEKLEAAIPVWIGGTYVPFLGCILVGVVVFATLGPAFGGPGVVSAALGAAIGAVAGRWLARRRSADEPVRSRALQVFLGITNRRVLIYEPKGFGKDGKLLAAFPVSTVSNVRFEPGGILRPGRLAFGVAGVEQTYEFSGLWNVEAVLEALV